MRAGLSSLVVVLLAGCGTGGNHRQVGTVAESLQPTAPVTAVRVVNGAGSAHVQRASGGEVVIEAEVWLREGRLDTDFTPRFADHVTVVDAAGTLSIESACLQAHDADDWQLRLTVSIPAGVSLDLRQAVGLVRVELPETRDARVHLGTGSIEFTVPIVRGALAVDVGTGEAVVVVQDSGPTEGLRAECGTGQLTVTLPADVRGSFELRASTGSIDCAPRYGLSEERSYTQVESRGHVGEGGPTFSLTVGTGQVRLR